MIRLFTDSDTDITPEVAKEYGYTVISMPYSVGTETVYPYKDSSYKFDVKEFYDMLRAGTLPSTSAISTEMYKEYFEPVFAAGDDILYVHFSEAMTMTFSNMRKALAELKEKYPDRTLYEIDTKAITIGSYGLVLEIGDMFKAGKDVNEILEWAKDNVCKFAMYFFADDLKFFQKSGRVSGMTAAMGTILGVRPIIYMSAEGQMVSIGKERGRNKALFKLVDYVRELGENIKDHRIIIGHSDALDIAQELGKMLTEEFGEGLRIEYVAVNPTAGSHCGPNAIGVCFSAKHR